MRLKQNIDVLKHNQDVSLYLNDALLALFLRETEICHGSARSITTYSSEKLI